MPRQTNHNQVQHNNNFANTVLLMFSVLGQVFQSTIGNVNDAAESSEENNSTAEIQI